MKNPNLQAFLNILIVLLVAAGVTWAGSQGSVTAFGMPLFALCAALAFVINWVAFVPAFLAQTERYFDLTGSITYLTVTALAVFAHPEADLRALLLAAAIAIWAVRLGTFLFRRILQDGSDGRFDELKPQLMVFLQVWTLQGLWVLFTTSCALAAITSAARVPVGWLTAVGACVWLGGFLMEAVADAQKRAFRKDPANEGRFITTGLWAWSRHPNYFGEITLWVGVALMAAPALSGWQWVTLISPVFVYVLLTRISGIPLLESRARKKWGDDPEFQAYKAATPVLVPRPPATR